MLASCSLEPETVNYKCETINWMILDPWHELPSTAHSLPAHLPVGTTVLRRLHYTNNNQLG